MATWIQSGKTFLRQVIPAGTEPSNPLLLEIAQALVRRRRSWWVGFIGRLDSIHPTLPDAVINPAADSDPWDIGTVDENDVFTPFSAGDRNTAMAGFLPWAFRVYEVVPAVRDLRKEREQLGAPAATETPAEAVARREAEARSYIVGEVGDDGDEVADS